MSFKTFKLALRKKSPKIASVLPETKLGYVSLKKLKNSAENTINYKLYKNLYILSFLSIMFASLDSKVKLFEDFFEDLYLSFKS